MKNDIIGSIIDRDLLSALLPDVYPKRKEKEHGDNSFVPVVKEPDKNKQERLLPNREKNGTTRKTAPVQEQQYVSRKTYRRESGEPLENYLRRNHVDLFYAGIIQSGITDEREIVNRSRIGYLEKGRAGKYYNSPEIKRERERVLAVLAGGLE